MGVLSDILGGIKLEDLGSIASIIGLVITVVVYLNIRKVKLFYITIIRLPNLTKRLSRHKTKLLDFYDNFKESQIDIELELAHTEVAVKSIESKLPRSSKKSAARVSNLIQKYNIAGTNFKNEKMLLEISKEITKLIDEVNDYLKDLSLEK